MDYLAHLDGSREQSVWEHLKGVADRASEFAEPFGAAECARSAGLCHDLGKYSEEFQRRIRGAAIQVDHSTAGAQMLWKLGDTLGAMAVAGHHGGLPDYGMRGDTGEDDTFLGRMKRQVPSYAPGLAETSIPEVLPRGAKAEDGFSRSFFLRMLYSSLVDADFLDTEAFMSPEGVARGNGSSIDDLETRFAAYAAAHWARTDTPLNRQRLAIRQRCEDAAANAPGLYALTVPTGGGKTASSMAFALKHARAYGKRRVIYVIPYTSIIEQNSAVFEAALGAENVIQHHSGVEFQESNEESPGELRRRLATENWDAPVIMTTAVQFLESLFADRSSRCRKLHNIAESVVIFDEAQMLPVQYLRPCVAAIAQLVKYYGVTAVLCTATQPSLQGLFAEHGLPITEICPNIQKDIFRRVEYSNVSGWDENTLLAHFQAQTQALCIVNTRKKALELFERLTGEGNFHLSTRMTPRHRKRILKEIRSRLAEGAPCRVVSTSLVEAGVDVDFPAVYREIAGMDSIVQAAGRCNREGKRAAPGTVYLFRLPGNVPQIIRQNVDAAQFVLSRGLLPGDERAIPAYFKCLYRVKGPEGLDIRGICARLAREELPMRTVARDFRLIEDDTMTVYIPSGENGAWLDDLRGGRADRFTLRRLEQDAVSVYPYQYRQLYDAGCLEELRPGTAVLSRTDCYREDTGLQVEPGQGCALFA